MRKTTLKKLDRNRHRNILSIRETYSSNIEEFTSMEGKVFYLNLKKRFLLNRPYKNGEFLNELNRKEYMFTRLTNKEKKDG